MFFFEGSFGKVFYTGDFRFDEHLEKLFNEHPLYRHVAEVKIINIHITRLSLLWKTDFCLRITVNLYFIILVFYDWMVWFQQQLDVLYLDNTYWSVGAQSCTHPKEWATFPLREQITKQIQDTIEALPDHIILIAMRKLGRERLICDLAEYLDVGSFWLLNSF